jgi:hypothetical protein
VLGGRDDSCGVLSSIVDIIYVAPTALDAYLAGPIARICQDNGFEAAGYDTQRRDENGYLGIACFRQSTVTYSSRVWVGASMYPSAMEVHQYAKLMRGCTGFLTGFNVKLAGAEPRIWHEVAIVPNSPDCQILTTTKTTLDQTLAHASRTTDVKNYNLAAHLLAMSSGFQTGFALNDNPSAMNVAMLGNCVERPPGGDPATSAPGTTTAEDEEGGDGDRCAAVCGRFPRRRKCERFRPFCRCRWLPKLQNRRAKVGTCVAGV